MQILYSECGYTNRENEKLKAELKRAFALCTTLDIYCGEENNVWGIWYEIKGVKYLVDIVELINSMFKDDKYYMFKKEPKDENSSYLTLYVRKDTNYYEWRVEDLILEDGRPLYFSYDEYVNKIRECVRKLYSVWQYGKPVAYDPIREISLEYLGIGLRQFNIVATLPSYYRTMTSSVDEETFVFNVINDEFHEQYTIGIGDRQYTTFLTHWDNSYDKIRYQFEGFMHSREATIELSFDDSNTVLKIRQVSVLDKIEEGDGGYGFSYKEYALVEIQPNYFVHGPIIKGYCDLKQTIKTLYEGFLTFAIAQPEESNERYEPARIEAYNMFKSPIIEMYITNVERDWNKAELRQVHVKRILTIDPDYYATIIDTENMLVEVENESGYLDEELYDKDGNPIWMPEIAEWHREAKPVILESEMGNVIPFDWEDYHRRGIELAQRLRDKLSPDFDLWYYVPLADKTSKIPRKVFLYNTSK